MNGTRGFTLIELLYAIAVGALVLAIGVPSFVDQIRSSRMNSATTTLLSALYVARSEAVKQRARITVCRSTVADQPVCDATAGGYTVFVNQADDSTFDAGAGDLVLRNDRWLAPGVRIVTSDLPNAISYVSSGFPRATGGGPVTGSVMFCDDRGDAAARLLVLPPTGRPQVLAHGAVPGAPACPN